VVEVEEYVCCEIGGGSRIVGGNVREVQYLI